jgi:hypothetical protein
LAVVHREVDSAVEHQVGSLLRVVKEAEFLRGREAHPWDQAADNGAAALPGVVSGEVVEAANGAAEAADNGEVEVVASGEVVAEMGMTMTMMMSPHPKDGVRESPSIFPVTIRREIPTAITSSASMNGPVGSLALPCASSCRSMKMAMAS